VSISESLYAQTRREIASIVCPVCQHEKKSGKPFCNRCYYDLPEDLKWDVGRLSGLELAIAYDETKDFLRVNRI